MKPFFYFFQFLIHCLLGFSDKNIKKSPIFNFLHEFKSNSLIFIVVILYKQAIATQKTSHRNHFPYQADLPNNDCQLFRSFQAKSTQTKIFFQVLIQTPHHFSTFLKRVPPGLKNYKNTVYNNFKEIFSFVPLLYSSTYHLDYFSPLWQCYFVLEELRAYCCLPRGSRQAGNALFSTLNREIFSKIPSNELFLA